MKSTRTCGKNRRPSKLGSLEPLEDRRLLTVANILSNTVEQPAGTEVVIAPPTQSTLDIEQIGGTADTVNDPDRIHTHSSARQALDPTIVTFILDFIDGDDCLDPTPCESVDGNDMGEFNIADYGFDRDADWGIVTQSIFAKVQQHYFNIPQMGTALGNNQELKVQFAIGDIHSPPEELNEFYFVMIGSDPASDNLGVALHPGVRNAAGGGPILANGSIAASIHTDQINELTNLTPANALMSGNLQFTTNAIAGTVSHEIAHTVSLEHISANTATPTGLPPIMGTGTFNDLGPGMGNLPNQARIQDREFATVRVAEASTAIGTRNENIFVVNQEADAVDMTIGDGGVVDVNLADGIQVSLRAAVQEAHASTVPATIVLPAGNYGLSLQGLDNMAAVGDLDITGNIEIVGAGMGATVINGDAQDDRVFEIRDGGSLTLDGLTVTGGHLDAYGARGAGVAVRGASSTLNLVNTAIVGNESTFGGGGGVAVDPHAIAVIRGSVITDNDGADRRCPTGSNGCTPAPSRGGAGLFVSSEGTITLGNSVVTRNRDQNSTTPVSKRRDFYNGSGAAEFTTSEGGNILGNITLSLEHLFRKGSDKVRFNPDRVVTSVVDEYAINSNNGLSLREAVMLDVATIALPAGFHALTHGEIVIDESIDIYGVGMGQSIVQNQSARADSDSPGSRVFRIDSGGSSHLASFYDLTITGGHLNGIGAGVYVDNTDTLVLNGVAVAGNSSHVNIPDGPNQGGPGGGIYVRNDATLELHDSVVTNNRAQDASQRGGGGVFLQGNGILVIGNSTVASNSANGLGSAARDIYHANAHASRVTSNGNNLLDKIGSSNLKRTAAFQALFPATLDERPDYIVTSIADTSPFGTDDQYSLSLREAAVLANSGAGVQKIWLPSGYHLLNIADPSGTGGAEVGALNLTNATEIRGVSALDSLVNVQALGLPNANLGTVFPGVTPTLTDARIIDNDVNDDSTLDVADLNHFVSTGWQIGNDQTGDGVTDLSDAYFTLHEGLGKEIGDANLDGTVDGQDFLAWNANKFGPGGWAEGDFNLNGFVDGADFLLWHQNQSSSSVVSGDNSQFANHIDYRAEEERNNSVQSVELLDNESGSATMPARVLTKDGRASRNIERRELFSDDHDAMDSLIDKVFAELQTV